MKVFCDDSPISREHIPTLESIDSLYQEKGSAVANIEFSRTNHTLRGRSNEDKPLELTFADRYNHNWKVIMDQKDEVIKMLIPCGSNIIWHGPDGDRSRIASGTDTDWAHLEFSYCVGTFMFPAGISVNFNAYKNSEKGEWKIDTEKWNTVLEMAKQGTEVTGALLD